MNAENSASEILERATHIRREASAEGRVVFTSDESEVLRNADLITDHRRKMGTRGILDSILDPILGEKRLAEQRLAELRATETKVELLATEIASAKKALEGQEATAKRVREVGQGYISAATPAGIRAIFEKKVWAMNEFNFNAHILQASNEAAAAKLAGENFEVFTKAADGAVAQTKARIADLERQLEKLRKS